MNDGEGQGSEEYRLKECIERFVLFLCGERKKVLGADGF
jgi:hypothetical protein